MSIDERVERLERAVEHLIAALSINIPSPGASGTGDMNSPYLTVEEAASYLRSTVQGIYALVKRGRVKPMPGSGKLLFTRAALDAYLEKTRYCSSRR